ncbi:MAG: hypothetical protein IJ591_01255 [Lachnospiraceae bacterium]|nr:hypothetical protein [Lachnospiraceae bacterium]
MSENHFAKALKNFTMDAAAGDAIRHLTDKGLSPSQVKNTLTFPAPMDYITKVMWDRLVETYRIIPDCGSVEDLESFMSGRRQPCEIMEHRDRYGRKSFIKVQKESPEEMIFSPEDYIVCDFARRMRSGETFTNDYIIHLPWPDRPVLGLREIFLP